MKYHNRFSEQFYYCVVHSKDGKEALQTGYKVSSDSPILYESIGMAKRYKGKGRIAKVFLVESLETRPETSPKELTVLEAGPLPETHQSQVL